MVSLLETGEQPYIKVINNIHHIIRRGGRESEAANGALPMRTIWNTRNTLSRNLSFDPRSCQHSNTAV